MLRAKIFNHTKLNFSPCQRNFVRTFLFSKHKDVAKIEKPVNENTNANADAEVLNGLHVIVTSDQVDNINIYASNLLSHSPWIKGSITFRKNNNLTVKIDYEEETLPKLIGKMQSDLDAAKKN